MRSIAGKITAADVRETGWNRWVIAFVALWIGTLATICASPWSLEGTTLAVLHGLCAQQPGHSFYFGDTRLPFDARMTGIYGGFLASALVLLARGRWRAGGIPPLRIAITLVGFVGLMGIDGLNSTLRDFGVWYAYEPSNTLRLVTGMLTGVALAVFIWLLAMQVGFAPAARSRRPAVASFRELAELLAVLAVYATAVLARPAFLRAPLTIALVVAAIVVMTGLTIAFVLLITRSDSQARATADLARPATISMAIALLVLGMMSGGRFALEAWLGISTVAGGV